MNAKMSVERIYLKSMNDIRIQYQIFIVPYWQHKKTHMQIFFDRRFFYYTKVIINIINP